jgi:tetratricopeptide (TPR) repeat protein
VTLALRHDLVAAQRYIDESLRRAKEAGLRSQEAQAAEVLGFIASHRSNYDAARTYFNESVSIYQEIGATFNVILEKSNLAHLERRLGNHAGALEYYRETISAFRDIGQRGAVAHQLECFGFIALAGDQYERALQLFAAANVFREKSSTPMTPDEQVYFDEQLNGIRDKLDAKQFEAIWSRGQAMTMEQAIEFALD